MRLEDRLLYWMASKALPTVATLWLLSVLLVSCTDGVPSAGHIYRCEGLFICYGDHFHLTPATGCADSIDEAEDGFYAYALELTKEAKCGDDWQITISCADTGALCTK